ncbi:MAG: TlyA family RNA methyltransferase [Solirubrobacterales bacterium]
MSRVRIDSLLAERGVFPSRSRAAAAVLAGEVQVGDPGRLARKPGELVGPDSAIHVADGPRYVSRGGHKLANALDALAIDPQGRSCLDAGASTGGFTDCLLQRGATRVCAADVAYGELAWALRTDDRVEVLERTNVRHLEPSAIGFTPTLVVADLSFIPLLKVLDPLASCIDDDGEMLLMVKPQFEVGRDRVGKGGVVRDPAERRRALRLVADGAAARGLVARGFASSGLPGPKGNRETFLWSGRRGEGVDVDAAIARVEP